MYLDFFGFETVPFGDTPEVHLFWDKHQSHEVFSSLLKALVNGDQLQLVLGEPGLGKTVLSRKLYNSLKSHKSRYQPFFMPSPHIELSELLKASRHQQGDGRLSTILLIDEAQALPGKTLSALADAISASAENNTPLQVVLFAQPELIIKLQHCKQRALQELVSHEYHLEPFNEQLTWEYLNTRIAEAGANPIELLDDQITKTLHESSKGVPRLINSLMRKALIIASQESCRTVNCRHLRLATTTLDAVVS